jgi:hypothetical protein
MTATHKNFLKTTISVVASSGLGALTISTASSGYRTFGAGDDGKTFDGITIREGTAWEICDGCVYTHSGTSLSRGTRKDSSTGSAIAFTSAAVVEQNPAAGFAEMVQLAMASVMPGGRLTLESGVPVSTTDQTAKTSVYYTPSVHNVVPLWDGYKWVPVEFSETTLALGTLTSGLEYNVYGYLSAGALVMEPAAWGSATVTFTNGTDVVNWTANPAVDGDIFFFNGGTAPTGLAKDTIYYVRDKATDSFKLASTPGGSAIDFTTDGSGTITGKLQNVTLQDGRYCKNGDKARLLLGSFCTTSTTTTEDSKTSRYLWNAYNRVGRRVHVANSTSHTYTTASWREWNNGTGVTKLNFISGLPLDSLDLSLIGTLLRTGTGAIAYLNMGYDATDGSSNLLSNLEGFGSVTVLSLSGSVTVAGPVGKHYATCVEYGVSSVTYSTYVLQGDFPC